MIFNPHLILPILRGVKTQTRRPTKPGKAGAPYAPCRYRVGRTYALQARRGGRAIARIHVDNVRREPLEAITDRDARREGFADRAEFFSYWLELYGRIDLRRDVWVITFEVVADDVRLLAPAARPDTPVTGSARVRSTRRTAPACGEWFEQEGEFFRCIRPAGHADHLYAALDQDELADDLCGDQPGPTRPGADELVCVRPAGHTAHRASLNGIEDAVADTGYVRDQRRALRDEPEPVEPFEQALITERAHRHRAAQAATAAAERDLVPLTTRLQAVHAAARTASVDVTREARLIAHLDAQTATTPASRQRALRRLEQLERRVIDREAA